MTLMIIYAALIMTAYLLGSISSAIIVCQLMGLPDPRSLGSGNPGATNVMRIGGKKAAAITLFGDTLKGLIPVLIGQLLDVPLLILACIGLAAFLGHLYPVFFRFQGGKGVATLLGVLLGINWMLGLAAIGTWLFMAYVVKISSLSALVMAALVPVYGWFLHRDWIMVGILTFMVLLLFWRHRNNIRNIMEGKEDRINDADGDADMQTGTLKDSERD
jgi:glycerol-3-phosphate acyltransferase PlsY